MYKIIESVDIPIDVMNKVVESNVEGFIKEYPYAIVDQENEIKIFSYTYDYAQYMINTRYIENNS